MVKRERSAQELPEAVKALIEARTGDAVYVVGPDYRIVHWDEQMESLSGVLSDEALGRPCYEAVLGEREDGGPFCAHGCLNRFAGCGTRQNEPATVSG